MPLVVPPGFRKFLREFAGSTRPGSVMSAVIMHEIKQSVQGRIKDQFKRGVGPDDEKHKPRKDGKPALVSSRLGNAARARVAGHLIYVEPKTSHVGDILDTHQDGHTYAARTGKVYQYRDKKNRLISYRKFVRSVRDAAKSATGSGDRYEATYFGTTEKGRQTIRGTRSVIGGVKFGPRKLPARPIRPVGSLTRPWGEAIARGFAAGIEKRIGKYQ